MNANDKVKGKKFNFIDALIILLVVAVIGVVAYLFLNNKIFSAEEKTEILYTIRIPLVKNELLPDIKKLEKGMTITDSVRGYALGTIEKVEITQATANYANRSNATYKKGEYPDYSKIVITVRADAVEELYGFDLKGYKIMVGEQIHFRTPYFISYGNCTSVSYADGRGKLNTASQNAAESEAPDTAE